MTLSALAKRPGEAMIGELVRLVEHYHATDEMQPYERLLGDALRGDHTLFGDEAGVEASWRIVDPVLDNTTPPHVYDQQTWGPAEAEALAAEVGGWMVPRIRV